MKKIRPQIKSFQKQSDGTLAKDAKILLQLARLLVKRSAIAFKSLTGGHRSGVFLQDLAADDLGAGLEGPELADEHLDVDGVKEDGLTWK